jgi:hypothetical protein
MINRCFLSESRSAAPTTGVDEPDPPSCGPASVSVAAESAAKRGVDAAESRSAAVSTTIAVAPLRATVTLFEVSGFVE